MVSPNFWMDPRNRVSYPLVVQTPEYNIESMDALKRLPLTGKGDKGGSNKQLLMNVASVGRQKTPMVVSQLNIQSVFDVHADTQGRDMGSVADDIDKIIQKHSGDGTPGTPKIIASGQIETMRESFYGLYTGIILAVVLVYLLMVMNFQSWIDPVIVLMAVPLALGGVMWMLYATHTHVSVPALMGALMCIGLTTANSILVVSFANQRMAAGDDALTAAIAAGYIRLRPVIMTAGAMILGMIPMAIGVGEGGEQNAPLGRAVIGGLIFATFATLVFVPAMYRLMRGRRTVPAVEVAVA
jgi:multidrug efflux pump subunit AcrB